MPDSLSEEEKDYYKKKALKFALKLPAGHISSKTPVQIAVAAALKKREPQQTPQVVNPEKKADLDLNNLSPFALFKTLNSVNKDWVNWLPETLWKEFKCDTVTQNKIRAIQILLTTPDVQFDSHGFYCLVKAFNNEIPDWSIIEPIPCHEIVYAWKNIELINKLELWPEVEAFIEACMKEEGLIYLPELDISLPGFDTANLKKIWENRNTLLPDSFNVNLDDPLAVQVARLLDIKRYLESMP